MSTSFHLREMLPSDGEALRQLMETDPETAEMSMTTVFRVDPYQAWSALKADMIGVVAEAPGVDGLVGVATVAFSDIQFEGQVLPCALLENLKVHHDMRRQGLGTQLAQWRIARARERFGEKGVIRTATTLDNTLSQATMKKWSKQFVGPVVVLGQSPRDSAPQAPVGIHTRAPLDAELEEVAARSNQFYADYNLYSPLSGAGLKALLAGNIYHYRVAVDSQGKIIAGMMLSERAKLLYDQFHNVPPPLKMSGILPPDERILMMEASFLWYDQLPVASALWESIRWEFHDRINTFSPGYDPLSPVAQVFEGADSLLTLEIIVALNAPTLMGTDRWLCSMLRG